MVWARVDVTLMQATKLAVTVLSAPLLPSLAELERAPGFQRHRVLPPAAGAHDRAPRRPPAVLGPGALRPRRVPAEVSPYGGRRCAGGVCGEHTESLLGQERLDR